MALFNGPQINSYFDKIYKALKAKICSYDYRQLKEFSNTDFNSIVEFYTIGEVSIDFEHASMTARNGMGEVDNYNYDIDDIDDELSEFIKVKGKYITVTAHISGDPSLLKYDLCEQSLELFNYCDNNYEEIDIDFDDSSTKCARFEIFFEDDELNGKSKEDILKFIKSRCNIFLKTTLIKINRLNSMIKSFNKSLPNHVHECIDEKIKDDSSLEFLSDAIGVELKPRNEFQDKNNKISIMPKKIDVMLPERKKYNGYYLDKDNYYAIISTIRNHLAATENNPMAIRKLNDEELIRDTILWALNGNYIVSSGESFRNNGKTDILIQFNDKSVFVAECKIWKGKALFLEGLNQLLSYSTWRDSKMSLIIFNLNNIDFGKVCSEAKEALKNYSGFKRVISNENQNFFECELTDSNNEESAITLSLICANFVSRNE